MSAFRRWLQSLRGGHKGGDVNPRAEEDVGTIQHSESGSQHSNETSEYFPTLQDVLKVRYLMQWKISKGFPTELVDEIIDAAEYWPSFECRKKDGEITVWNDRDHVILKTIPLCFDRQSLSQSSTPRPLPHRSAHPCRKIIFNIESNDQGFGQEHEDMYHFSWTWFDTEVIRAAHTRNMYVNGIEQELLANEQGQRATHFGPHDEKLLPRDDKLVVNRARVGEPHSTEITWHYLDNVEPDSPEADRIEHTCGRGRDTLDGRGVRQLEVGDSLALWARARFPGWTNHVHEASARVFWAV